jgi:ketosteroid isomerase-like protein
MSQENVALVRSLYDCFADGNVAALLGALSPDVIWNEAENFPYADRNPYRGPQAVGEGLFARLAADWDLAVVPQEFLDAGDTVVVLGRFQGHLKANGAALDAQFAHVFRIAGGKVVAYDEYADTLQTAQVMNGASAAMAVPPMTVATLAV